MMVLVLSSCPPGLRGFLSRWLLEVSAGVFAGTVSARIRDSIWAEVKVLCKDGRAILIHPARNEQRLEFKVHRHKWGVKDFDGVKLIARPRADSISPKPLVLESTEHADLESQPAAVADDMGLRVGWSNMSKYRRGNRR
ncbi:type I-E CRISPR-associated endoribonuclease Cas2e [Paeniglutamicibacter cryotolerans]|uniref:CRISPR-associated protein Cas2 n=1 Tax=Paeniglutamicibacter cryotolerans TaxID=670079 RepID=A0A839QML2_9MICC|nr:type I-E CRISPR-associated endoribonuclease Cas2e [Paeniglutamicibacter cryotolerans]MBB2997489.1 CRISPR-associated protein Cas2 [Paeniglutamicibacter cryotolerans]